MMRFATSLESASVAIGVLSGALRRHPLAMAWTNRTAIEQALKLVAIDGFAADRDLMLAWLAELPVRVRRDVGATSRALRVFRCLISATRTRIGHAEPDEEERGIDRMCAALDQAWPKEGPVLWGVAHALAKTMSQSAEKRSTFHVSVPRLLAARGLIPFPYPKIGGVFGRAADVSDPEAFAIHVVDAVRREAESGLILLAELTIDWIGRHDRVRRKRRQSKLPRAVDLASIFPVISPALVARHLGITVRGAAMILAELAEDGLITEIAGRKSWKAYVAPENGTMRSVLVERGTALPSERKTSLSLPRPEAAEQSGDPPAMPRSLTLTELTHIADSARLEELPAVESWKSVIDLDELMDDVNRTIRRVQSVLGGRPAVRDQRVA